MGPQPPLVPVPPCQLHVLPVSPATVRPEHPLPCCFHAVLQHDSVSLLRHESLPAQPARVCNETIHATSCLVQGDTPLHNAVGNGQTFTTAMLLSKGADVHAKDKQVTSAFNSSSRPYCSSSKQFGMLFCHATHCSAGVLSWYFYLLLTPCITQGAAHTAHMFVTR